MWVAAAVAADRDVLWRLPAELRNVSVALESRGTTAEEAGALCYFAARCAMPPKNDRRQVLLCMFGSDAGSALVEAVADFVGVEILEADEIVSKVLEARRERKSDDAKAHWAQEDPADALPRAIQRVHGSDMRQLTRLQQQIAKEAMYMETLDGSACRVEWIFHGYLHERAASTALEMRAGGAVPVALSGALMRRLVTFELTGDNATPDEKNLFRDCAPAIFKWAAELDAQLGRDVSIWALMSDDLTNKMLAIQSKM